MKSYLSFLVLVFLSFSLIYFHVFIYLNRFLSAQRTPPCFQLLFLHLSFSCRNSTSYLFRLRTPHSPTFPIQTHAFSYWISGPYIFIQTHRRPLFLSELLFIPFTIKIQPSSYILIRTHLSSPLLFNHILFPVRTPPSFLHLPSKFLFLLLSYSNTFSFRFLFELTLRPLSLSDHMILRILLFEFYSPISSNLFKHILLRIFIFDHPLRYFRYPNFSFFSFPIETATFLFVIRNSY